LDVPFGSATFMSRESAFLRTRSTTAAASQENHESTTREVGSDERGKLVERADPCVGCMGQLRIERDEVGPGAEDHWSG